MITRAEVDDLIERIKTARNPVGSDAEQTIADLHDLVIEFVRARLDYESQGAPKDSERYDIANAAVFAVAALEIRTNNGGDKLPTHVPQGRERSRREAAKYLDRHGIGADAFDRDNVSGFLDGLVDAIIGPAAALAPLELARNGMFAASRVLTKTHEQRFAGPKTPSPTMFEACRAADRELQRAAVSFVAALAMNEDRPELAASIIQLTKGIGA